MAVLACAAFAACEKTPVNGPEVDGDIENSYISIQLASAPATRAEVLEDGLAGEVKVNTVRLYFFDVNGNASNCVSTDTGFQNYYDFVSPTNTDVPSANDNIDDKVAAVVVISTAKGDKLPAKVAAVINRPNDNIEVSTVAKLREVVSDYSLYTSNNFVMTSTTYATAVDGTGARMDVVNLTTDNFKKTAAEAQAKPVSIYVERVLAKVRVNAGAATAEDITVEGATLYYTGQTVDKRVNGQKIYVKFVGWLPTATADKSYLIKNINPAWTESTLFTAWTNPTFYRSYWAINPTSMAVQYYTYDEIAAHKGFDGTTPAYCQENAALTDGVRTKLIVAAQLVKEDGSPIEIAEWNGVRYADENVKDAMLATLQREGQVITIDGTAIAKTDITFVTEKVFTNGAYGHLVYAKLTEEAAAKTITGAATSAETANTLLSNLGSVMYWNDGMTYYYTDIKHLGGAGQLGEYGVVRNHIYNVDITNVVGLGTPVYDPSTPTEEIIPEKPTYQDTYLAAEINILSWRVVDQDVELN